MNILETINNENLKTDLPALNVGDTVKVQFKIIEGSNTRVQTFSGIIIAMTGAGINQSITVRRVSYGQGVERIFPLHSPRLEKISVERKGSVRRAKLYYLRDKVGKAARVKEKSSY